MEEPTGDEAPPTQDAEAPPPPDNAEEPPPQATGDYGNQPPPQEASVDADVSPAAAQLTTELRQRIEKLAQYVRSNPAMEAHVRSKQSGNVDFDFLNGGDGAEYFAELKARYAAMAPPPAAPVMAPPPPNPYGGEPQPPPGPYPGDPRPPPGPPPGSGGGGSRSPPA